MNAPDQTLLALLPAWSFAFALIMARVGAASMLLPGVGEAELPATIRVGFALVLTLVLLPGIGPSLPHVADDVWTALKMIAGEIGTGLLLGWLARLVLLSLGVAGQFIASLTGLANVLQPDPMLGPQATAVGRLFTLAAPVLVLSSGLHTLPIAALAGSYRVIPCGSGFPSRDALDVAVAAVGEMFGHALQLAGPFVLADIVWQVGLGLLARLVPQLQSYFAAVPGQIIGGLGLLALAAGTIAAVWLDRATAVFANLPGLAGP